MALDVEGAHEAARIAALDALEIMDTESEDAFDAVTQAASVICGTPIALVSLVHEERLWFKSAVGLDVRQSPRHASFCAHAIHEPALFEVEDASEDARFANNPAVVGEPHIRFYAGVPLVGADNYVLGTLCVIDYVARALLPWQKIALTELSRVASRQLAARKKAIRDRGRLDRIIAMQAQLANADLDLGQFLDKMLMIMRDEIAANAAIVALSEGEGLVVKAASGTAAAGLGVHLEGPRSLCVLCVATGEILTSENCAVDPRVDREAMAKTGSRSAICMPLVHDGKTFGAMMLMASETNVFQPAHKDMLTLMAGLLNAAVKHRIKFDANRKLVAAQAVTLEALREAEDRFRGSFVTAAQGMALVSLEGRFIEVNRALCDLLGYTESEMLEIDFQSVTHPADLGVDLKNIEALIAGKISSYLIEKRYRHKNRLTVWTRLAVSLVRASDGTPRYFVAQIQDLSAQKRLEEAQRRNDGRFKRLIQGVTDYAIYTLSPEGRVTSWNAGAERIKGYAAHEIVGKHFELFFSTEDRAHDAPKKVIEIATRTGKFEGDVERVRADGSRFRAHVVLDAVRDANGDLAGFTKVTRDIPDARQAP